MKRRKWVAFMLVTVLMAGLIAACGKGDSGSSSGGSSSGGASSGSSSSSSGGSSSGGSSSGGSSDGSSEQMEVLKVGFVDPLTGPGAVFGVPQSESVDMAVEEINNNGGVKVGDKAYKIELIKYDNKADANEAINAVRKLIDRDGVKFILGHASSTPTLAVVQMVAEEDVLLLVGYAAEQSIVTQGNKNVFRNRTPSGYTGAPAGEFAAKNGVKRLAFLGQKDLVYQSFFKYFKERFEANGGEVIAEEVFSLGDRDMYTQLTKIISLNPDAILTPGYVEQAAFVYKQARELGYTGPFYGFTGGSEEQYLEIVPKEYMEGIYDVRPEEIPEVDRSQNNINYFINYEKKYGKEPVPIGLYAYDQVYVLKAAIEKAGSLEVGKVIEALRDLEPPKEVTLNYLTINGKMFDENGQAFTRNVALQWQGDGWKFAAELPNLAEEFSQELSRQTQETLAQKK